MKVQLRIYFCQKNGKEDWVITSRKITSTKNLIKVVTEGKTVINNVLCYQTIHSHIKVYSISNSEFVNDLSTLQSNLFAETLHWKYERVEDSAFGEFMIFCNCGKMKYGTGYSAHMRVNDGVSTDEVEKILSSSE